MDVCFSAPTIAALSVRRRTTAIRPSPIVLIILFLALQCLSSFAWSEAGRATVRLDGRALFEVGSVEEGVAARGRADAIESRLARVLENPAGIVPVTVTKEDGNRVLTLASRELATVTPEDARDNLVTTDALALQWKRAIDRGLERAQQRRESAWGRFGTETQASVETAFARLLESAITVIPRLLAVALVLLLFWALASVMRWLMRIIFHRVVSDLTVENLIKQVVYYAIWAIGLVVATSALGFDPQAMATGLGLTGVALGFALKDILSNFVAGLLILTMRPFELGDQIVIGDIEGAVERIHLRATRIRTYDGRAVLVPNAEVFTSRITNNTESPIRRGVVRIPLGYGANLDEAITAVLAAANEAEGVLDEPPPSVRVRDLTADNVLLEGRFWTDSRRSDFVLTASNLRGAVVKAFRQADIGLPDPAINVVMPSQPAAPAS